MIHEELPMEHDDPLIRRLHVLIRFSVRVLAILMAAVILWSVADVVYVIVGKLKAPPVFLISIGDIFDIFAAFMAVLIAIEIFINIRLYLGTDVVPVQLVIATALMAIARKVIVLDFDDITAEYVLAIAAVVMSLGLTYWLVSKAGGKLQ